MPGGGRELNRIDDIDRTLLIVDDELHLRQSYSDYFEDRGWQVSSAESGEAALELLQAQPCCAAIVDIRLGGMDGERFIREALTRCSQMVFVICTGSPEYKLAADVFAEERVASEVFAKPVSDIRGIEQMLLRLLQDVGSSQESPSDKRLPWS